MSETSSTNLHTSLILAALKGDVGLVTKLRSQTNVDLAVYIDGSPYTAVHAAASQGNLAVLNALLEAQADANGGSSHGFRSPIHLATLAGHADIVKALLQAQADPDLRDNDGQTALYISVKLRHWPIVKLLVDAQANANCVDDVETSPLHLAVGSGYLEAVVSLAAVRDLNADLKQMQGATALHFAAQIGQLEAAVALIKHFRADVNMQADSGVTPLFLAAQDNQVELIDSLIKSFADPNLSMIDSANRKSPLYVATAFGFSRAVARLIRAEADVNKAAVSGTTPLYIAAQNGHEGILAALLSAGADVDCQQFQGVSPLYVACQKGHHGIVDALIKAQASTDLRAITGDTALFVAAQNGHTSIVEKLIKAQASLDLQRVSGLTALSIAAQNGHLQVVQVLIKANANVDGGLKDPICSPLCLASEFNHIQIVQALIDAQADINLAKDSNSSALYAAAFNGHCDIVKALVCSGAEVVNDKPDGFSPVHAAVAGGQWHVLRVLRELGVRISVETCELLRGIAYVLRTADADKVPRELTRMTSSIDSLENELSVDLAGIALTEGCDDSSLSDEFEPINAESSAVSCSESEMSSHLHSSLCRAGFTAQRASLQGAAADVLEEVLRRKVNYADIFVVGSYSETWGNNLVRVDGRTDSESDIDITRLIQGRTLHINGICTCPDAEPDATVEYSAGHILCSGYSSNPAEPMYGSTLRPAVDRVGAFRLCCYPPIGPLQPDRVSKSKIPSSVLHLLSKDVATTSCHVVHAAPPGQAGKQLRVSTTFLEKRLLRSLSTLQGQLFVTLKFLIKKVVSQRVQGLKAYHAKTLTFRMLEETPAKQWTPKNLVDLIRLSLNMLLDCVINSCSNQNEDGRIMEHFFLSDAHLYLKGVNRNTAKEVAQVLTDVIDQLPQLLTKFIKTLRPLDNTGLFYFHPLLILPRIDARWELGSGRIEFHEIYDIVRYSVLQLSAQSQESIFPMVERLPDCAKSARECLKILDCLKFGNRKSAEILLLHCSDRRPSQGIQCRVLNNSDGRVSTDLVWRYLRTNDSVWKFSLDFSIEQPKLAFLPEPMGNFFPSRMRNYSAYFYLNFNALLTCLQLEFGFDDSSTSTWFEDAFTSEDLDDQELMVVLHYCPDPSLVTRVFNKFRRQIHDSPVEKLIIRELYRRSDSTELLDL